MTHFLRGDQPISNQNVWVKNGWCPNEDFGKNTYTFAEHLPNHLETPMQIGEIVHRRMFHLLSFPCFFALAQLDLFGISTMSDLGSRELLMVHRVLGRLPTTNASAKARVGIGTCDEDDRGRFRPGNPINDSFKTHIRYEYVCAKSWFEPVTWI